MPRPTDRKTVAIAFLLVVLICTAFAGEVRSQASPAAPDCSAEQYATMSFPVDSWVIPMDGKQSDRLKAFGLVHLIARRGGVVYRIIEPPDVSLCTQLEPSGVVFLGGPLLVLPGDEAILRSAQGEFGSVTVLRLTKGFTSDRVCEIRRGTSILLVQGSFGRTELVLSEMGIPYTVAQRADVATNPQMLGDFDLIVDDCPGWRAGVPPEVISAMRDRVATGGEIIFTDIAIDDLDQVFPGRCVPIDNADGTWDFVFSNPGEFLTQYSGPPTLALATRGGGVVVASVSEDVTVFLESQAYGNPGGPAIAGFYFSYWDGIVEGLAFHPPDQESESSRILASAVFGNKFVHSAPVVPTPRPSPTPGAVCVDWEEYTREEFVFPSLPGWLADDGHGVVEVESSILHLGSGTVASERFPVLARNDAFPPEGDISLEVSFRFSEVAPYGTTIGVGSVPYAGERYAEGEPAPEGIEDVLSIHQFSGSFQARLLGGSVVWDSLPGDEDWHHARMEVRRRGEGDAEYSLVIDGRHVGTVRGGQHPVSIFLGNPSVQLYPGPWTELQVDCICVKYCEAWGTERVRLPLVSK